MSKMTRPVMMHLAKMNFKNWNRLDEMILTLNIRLKDPHKDYVLHLGLRDELDKVRDDIKFIDETLRVWLDED